MSHLIFLIWVPLERLRENTESNKEHKKQYDVEVLNFWRNFLQDQPVFQPFLRLQHTVKQFQASEASRRKVNSKMLIQEDLQGHAGKQWRPTLGPGRQLVRYPFSLYVKDFPKWRKLQCQRIMKQRNLRSFKMVQLWSRFCVNRYASYYINQVVLPLVNSDLTLSFSWSNYH